MSFPGSLSDAKGNIASVELSENTRTSSGTSPIYKGVDTPGGMANSAKPAHETQQVGRLRAGINKPKTRTDKLTRKYAAS